MAKNKKKRTEYPDEYDDDIVRNNYYCSETNFSSFAILDKAKKTDISSSSNNFTNP
jgi:hypothetical protein